MNEPIFSRIMAAKVERIPQPTRERIKSGDSLSSLSFLRTCKRSIMAGIIADSVRIVLADKRNPNIITYFPF